MSLKRRGRRKVCTRDVVPGGAEGAGVAMTPPDLIEQLILLCQPLCNKMHCKKNFT